VFYEELNRTGLECFGYKLMKLKNMRPRISPCLLVAEKEFPLTGNRSAEHDILA
jgi:hypothetical protein